MKNTTNNNFVQNISSILLFAWLGISVIMVIVCLHLGFSHPAVSILGQKGTNIINADYYYTRFLIHRNLFITCGILSVLFSIVVIKNFPNFFRKDKIKESPWLYLLLLSIPWAFICCIVSGNFFETFFGRKYLFNGLFSFILFGGAFFCAFLIKSEQKRLLIIKVFSNTIFFLAIILVLQAYFFPVLDRCFNPDFATIFNQHNHFGYVLCMSIVATMTIFMFDSNLTKVRKTFYMASFSLQIIALLINDTFGSYLAIILSFPIIYLVYLKKYKNFDLSCFIPLVIFIVIGIMSSFGLFAGTEPIHNKLIKFVQDVIAIITNSKRSNSAGTGRGYLWKETIKRIKKRPLFGYGPAGLIGENAIINAGRSDSPHNEFLQRAVCTGIPGLILYVSALFLLYKNLFKKIQTLNSSFLISFSITLVYLLSSCFGNPVFNTAYFFYIFLGFTASISEQIPEEINIVNINKLKQLFKDGKIVKDSIVTIIISTIILSSTYLYFSFKNEPINELADLSAMKAAKAAADLIIAQSDVKEGDCFLFDAKSMSLLPPDTETITSYGQGTIFKGNTLLKFNTDNNANFIYDEKDNYTNKVITVVIVSENNALVPKIEWQTIYYPVLGG